MTQLRLVVCNDPVRAWERERPAPSKSPFSPMIRGGYMLQLGWLVCARMVALGFLSVIAPGGNLPGLTRHNDNVTRAS